MIKTLALNTAALILGTSPAEVLTALQQPGVIREKIGIAEKDHLVIRDGLERITFASDGTLIKRDTQQPQPERHPDVRIASVPPGFESLLAKVRDFPAAQQRFREDFPEHAEYLTSFLTKSGCGICRTLLADVLRRDCTRSKLYLEYLATLTQETPDA